MAPAGANGPTAQRQSLRISVGPRGVRHLQRACLQDRYGWKYGLPAHALVAYVSYVRVDTDHHRWRDVAAGAAVSYGISKLFVTPENATHLAPVIGPDFLGMRWERSF